MSNDVNDGGGGGGGAVMTDAVLATLPNNLSFGSLSYDKATKSATLVVNGHGGPVSAALSLSVANVDLKLGEALKHLGEWAGPALADKVLTKQEAYALIPAMLAALPVIFSGGSDSPKA